MARLPTAFPFGPSDACPLHAELKTGDHKGAAFVVERLKRLAPIYAAAMAHRTPLRLPEDAPIQQIARAYTIELSSIATEDIASLALDLADGLFIQGTLSLTLSEPPRSRDLISKRTELLLSLGSAYLLQPSPASEAAAQFITVVKCDDWRRPALITGSDKAFVLALYRDLLSREADEGGLRCYTAELAEGATPMQILRTFMLSSERRARRAALVGSSPR